MKLVWGQNEPCSWVYGETSFISVQTSLAERGKICLNVFMINDDDSDNDDVSLQPAS